MNKLITSQEEFEQFVKQLESSRLLAIDTEFMREKTYYAKLCLLQFNNGEISALIDPLSVHDLSPLIPILTDENCVKIFHAGSQDIAILFNETGVTPKPVFDTQVAASLLGYPLQVGYGPLVNSVCNVKLAKADSFTEWSRRPLSNNQLKYALDDVEYLPQIYEQLHSDLEEKGRLNWCEKDFIDLADPNTYKVDPREMWQKVKRISSLSRPQLAIVREVAAWRESEAMRRNLPRKWVLADEAVIEIARKAPKRRERLLEVRGLANKLSSRDVNQILDAVRRGREVPQDQWPKLACGEKGDVEGEGAVELLSALLEVRAKENGVAAPLIATHSDLSKLVRGHKDDLPLLEGWRYEIAGRELVDLFEGHLGLYLKNGEIEIVNL